METAELQVPVRLDREAVIKIGQHLGAEIVDELGIRPYLARKVPRVVLGFTTWLTQWGEPLATEDFDGLWIPVHPEVNEYWGLQPEGARRQRTMDRTVANLFANSQVV